MALRQPLRVGAVLSSATWWRRLHAHAADHGSDVEVVVVRDVHAVLESALQVVCVDDTVPWFTKAMVARAGEAGITVVGVFLDGDQASDARLAGLGVEHRVSDTVAVPSILDLLTRLRPLDPFDEIVSHLEPPRSGPVGSLVTVGGPPGAGTREVGLGFGTQLAARGPTVVVDCNESSPGVAARLGLRLQPHVLNAVELATAGRDLRDVVAVPAGTTPTLPFPFDVVAGIPSPSEWQRFPPAAADVVLAACRNGWRHTVVLTSPVVEDLRRWIDRYGLSRHLLSGGELVVGVCEASPRGVLRFAAWLAELKPPVTVATVVNKAPARFATVDVVEQLRSLCGERIDVIATVPFDRRVTAAEWDASLPAKGPFTRAMRGVVDQLLATRSAAPLLEVQ
jgi:hypothetical protein